jgi:hypothetical protein
VSGLLAMNGLSHQARTLDACEPRKSKNKNQIFKNLKKFTHRPGRIGVSLVTPGSARILRARFVSGLFAMNGLSHQARTQDACGPRKSKNKNQIFKNLKKFTQTLCWPVQANIS